MRVIYPKQKHKRLEDQKGNLFEEKRQKRLAAKTAAFQKELGRHMEEYAKLHKADERVAWLRGALAEKRIKESGLMLAMDQDRSGVVTFKEWEQGLRDCGIYLSGQSVPYRQLFRLVDRDSSRVVCTEEIMALLYADHEIVQKDLSKNKDIVEEAAGLRVQLVGEGAGGP